MKVYVIVKDYEVKPDGKLKVYYSTWDGHCICTKQSHSDIITEPDKEYYSKRDVHLEVLKQLYNQ